MYPDLRDVAEQLCHLKGAPRPTEAEFASRTWPTVVLLQQLLSIMYSWCRNHGRHRYTECSQIKKLAESFLGAISDYEFCLALLPGGTDRRIQPHTIPIDVSKFAALKLKFPPLGRFDDAVTRERWAEIRTDWEQEIAEELELVAGYIAQYGQGNFNQVYWQIFQGAKS